MFMVVWKSLRKCNDRGQHTEKSHQTTYFQLITEITQKSHNSMKEKHFTRNFQQPSSRSFLVDKDVRLVHSCTKIEGGDMTKRVIKSFIKNSEHIS